MRNKDKELAQGNIGIETEWDEERLTEQRSNENWPFCFDSYFDFSKNSFPLTASFHKHELLQKTLLSQKWILSYFLYITITTLVVDLMARPMFIDPQPHIM